MKNTETSFVSQGSLYYLCPFIRNERIRPIRIVHAIKRHEAFLAEYSLRGYSEGGYCSESDQDRGYISGQ